MMKRFFLVIALTALMAGCGSSVKLDKVPVEDKTGTAVQSTAGGAADGNTVGKSKVESVDLSRSNQDVAGPNGVARLVYFDYDSYVVKPEFQSLLEAHARFLKANAARKIVIEGHTDERGGREYNLALGQKRSEAVRRALALLGVGDSQVEAVSFGKEKPADPGHDEAAMAKNRRAEIVYH
jgi:peptidoglycan-associated lipoprotein